MGDKRRVIHTVVWAVGGATLLGLGVVLNFLPYSALAFAGVLVAGIGLGLLIAALLTRKAE